MFFLYGTLQTIGLRRGREGTRFRGSCNLVLAPQMPPGAHQPQPSVSCLAITRLNWVTAGRLLLAGTQLLRAEMGSHLVSEKGFKAPLRPAGKGTRWGCFN